MKIAIDISQIAYEGTGVAEYTREMVKSLLKIDKKNEYLLFGLSLRNLDRLKDYFDSIKYLSGKASVRLFPIPQSLANLLWNRLHFLNIEKLIGKVDIFHSSDWIQPNTSAKKVTTVHDLVVYKYPKTSHPYIVEVQKRRLNWVKKECDLILADSRATKDDLVKILHMDSSKIEVVYPGISDEYKRADSREITRVRLKYGLTDDFILTVGTLEPRKNFQSVAEAFEHFSKHSLILSRGKPVQLVIVGKPGWGEKVKPSKSVRILGFVDRIDLPGLYSAASVFIYPSLYEGFGFPVIEAMKCGCVVITSDRGSLKELVNDSGILVNPLSIKDISIKLTQFFVDKQLRDEYLEKAKKQAAKFSWEKSAGRILDFYQGL